MYRSLGIARLMTSRPTYLQLDVRRAILSAVLALATTRSLVAENWPSWRGPEGTGVSHESNLPFTWSATENIRWKVNLSDPGNSTPIVWEKHIFVTQPVV